MFCPFYHSRLFWLGLPGLLFLLWSWEDSGKAIRTISWNGKGMARQVDLWNGVVRVVQVVDPKLYAGPMQKLGIHRAEIPLADRGKASPGGFVFAPLISAEEDEHALVRIPFWFAICLYLPAWWTTLIWWQRRKVRLLILHSGKPEAGW